MSRPLCMAMAALLALVVHAGVLRGPFLYDDVGEILENERVHSLSNIPALLTTDFWDAGQGRNPLYRPLAAVMATVLWVGGGGRPWPYHLLNLLLHAGASALLVALVHRLTGQLRAGLIAGLLFATHPVHTEAVLWITQHAELTSSVCVLGAWLLHLKGRIAWAAVLLGSGLLAKEGAVVFPALVLAGDWLDARAPRAPLAPRAPRALHAQWRAYAVYAGVIAVYLAIRAAILGHLVGGISEGPPLLNPLRGLAALDRILSSVLVFGEAARQSLVPSRLCLDYGYNQIPPATGVADVRLLVWLAVFAAGAFGLAAAARRGGPRGRAAAAGAIIFVCAFLPTSNLLFPGISMFAERNLYLPTVGVCLVLGALLDPGEGRSWRRSVLPVTAALLVAAGAARSWMRVPEFDSRLALFGAAARACPQSARAHMFHGMALREHGLLTEAMAEQAAALRIAPHSSEARAEMGMSLLFLGDLAGAERELSEALRLNARDREARSHLASVYARTGRLDQALELGREGVALFPDDREMLNGHASTLVDAGRFDEAVAIFEHLNRVSPRTSHGPNGLGAILAHQGRWAEAADQFREARDRVPSNLNATLNLATALAKVGRMEEALIVLDKAAASGMDDPEILQLRAQLSGSAPRQ
ncbi:MAG: tetratricopeptide repeat protein [Candidatus Polarisedimenticolia bacterium]